MNNPPAFPTGTGVTPYNPGMTLRDYFAARAIGITASNKPPAYDDKTIAKYAYEMADAMLAAREKK